MLCFLLLPFCGVAQWKYEINGTVTKGSKRLEGAVITVFKGSSQVQQVTTGSNGKFEVALDEGADFTVTVTKPGYITKKFFFSTKGVPEDVAKAYVEGHNPGIKPEIGLFELPKDPAVVAQINQILSQPMAKAMYDDKLKDIEYDRAYSQSMLEAIERLSQIEKEANKKAEEEAKNKSAMESAAASKYQAAIAKGDAAMAKKDYTTARAAYTDALSIKVGEPYPKDKIIEIEKLQADAAKNAQIDADYRTQIAKADGALSSKNYEVAKSAYSEAQKLKPAEAYPKTKLDEIAKILADAAKNAELNAKYDAAIAKADKAFAAKTYDAAKAAYNEAIALKSAEKYPKDRIAEIDKALADAAAKEKAEKELEAKYTAAIAKADQALAAKDYTSAKTAYTDASTLKPAEAYPKTKLSEIEKLLAELAAKEKAGKELEEKYKAAIAKADAAFTAKDYVLAKSGYNEALALKTEQYPKDRIAEADKLLAEIAAREKAEKDKLAKEKELNDKYSASIAKGDASLAKGDLAAAKTSFTEASGFKPAEQYPKDKLAEIEKSLADKAKAAETDAKYKAAIAKADASLKVKKYDEAKSDYNEALALKGSEQYPKDKLAEIDNLLAKDAAAKELNEKYSAAIAKADAAFAAKTWDQAKVAYNEALVIKSTETYPKTKITEIDKIIADAAAKEKAEAEKLAKAKEMEEKYAAAMSRAEASFSAKDYSAARGAYNEALTIKPAELAPKEKIKEIDSILAKELSAKQLEEKYTAALSKGDAALSKKDLAAAKAAYGEASGLKPSEQLPKDKLAEISKLMDEAAAEKERLAKIAETESRYKAAVAKADAAFKTKSWAAAKTAYQEATAIKDAEQYPKDKIAEIDAILAKELDNKALEEKYKTAVAKADAALKTKDYAAAKDGYGEALGLKPAESYPKTKLAEIEKAIADAAAKEQAEKERLAKQKELDEKYLSLISKADASLAAKELEAAKASYTEALALKSGEKYPKDKLAEVNAIIAREMGAKELEKKYADAIQKGDAAVAGGNFSAAKTEYTAAIALKPGEQYPKDKLAEAEKALADKAAALAKENAEKALAEKYQAAITKGDKALAAKTYSAAKQAYEEALALKGSEQYPKDKISEIEKLMGEANLEKERAALEAKYKAAITKADAAFKAKTYEPAKAAYNEALAVKPGDQYATAQIAEADRLAAEASSAKELAAIETKYKAAITKADAAFKAKTYESAKTAYNEALSVKPGDQYATAQIAEADRLAAEASSAKELAAIEAKYKAAITKADAAFKAKTYESAKTAYNEALSVKPGDQYATAQIAEADRLAAEAGNAKEIAATEAKYKAAIAKADAALKAKNYEPAKAAYNEALAVKANDQYAQDKLTEIDKLVAEASTAKERAELDAKYKAAIAKADAAFKAKTYEQAKAGYDEAIGIKAEEQYPKDQLSAIDKLIAETASKTAAEKEINERYSAAISKADAALAAKDYEGARSGYNEALTIKAGEKYPKDKIASIDALLAKENSARDVQTRYDAAIAKADAAYAANDFTAAKASYSEALTLKAVEAYPKDQLAKISSTLAAQAAGQAAQAKYDAAIAKADKSLADKDFAAAIASYKQAQAIKPSEPYPANKIAEANKSISDAAKAKEKEKLYADAIAKADKLFAAKDYKAAKSSYLDAALAKPTERYPKDKTAECDNFLKKKTGTTTTAATGNKNDFKSELAKKYPEGITEESATENNAKVTRRIVVKGDEGHVYVKKITSFGPVYYFKDNVPITEGEFLKDTEVQN